MRIFLSVAAGVVMGLLLFFLMSSLIAGAQGYDQNRDRGHVVDFIRVRKDELDQIKERTPPKKISMIKSISRLCWILFLPC